MTKKNEGGKEGNVFYFGPTAKFHARMAADDFVALLRQGSPELRRDHFLRRCGPVSVDFHATGPNFADIILLLCPFFFGIRQFISHRAEVFHVHDILAARPIPSTTVRVFIAGRLILLLEEF